MFLLNLLIILSVILLAFLDLSNECILSKRKDGSKCKTDKQCRSNFCYLYRCEQMIDPKNPEIPKLRTAYNFKKKRFPTGAKCQGHDDCLSRNCINEICNDIREDRTADDMQNPTPRNLLLGARKLRRDRSCLSNSDCDSGNCVEGFCEPVPEKNVEDEELCAYNYKCHSWKCVDSKCIPLSKLRDKPKIRGRVSFSEDCAKNDDCETGKVCVKGVCSDILNKEDSLAVCEIDHDCQSGNCLDGLCSDKMNGRNVIKPRPVANKFPLGFDCKSDSQCVTNICENSKCVQAESKSIDEIDSTQEDVTKSEPPISNHQPEAPIPKPRSKRPILNHQPEPPIIPHPPLKSEAAPLACGEDYGEIECEFGSTCVENVCVIKNKSTLNSAAAVSSSKPKINVKLPVYFKVCKYNFDCKKGKCMTSKNDPSIKTCQE